MKRNTRYRTKQKKKQEKHIQMQKNTHSFSEEFQKNRKPEAIRYIQRTCNIKKKKKKALTKHSETETSEDAIEFLLCWPSIAEHGCAFRSSQPGHSLQTTQSS